MSLFYSLFCQSCSSPDNLFSVFCQAILDVMVNLQFTLVETLWKTFWRFSQSQAGDATLAV